MKESNERALPLRVADWVDAEGQRSRPLELGDLGTGYKVLFFFQHACPACHQEGFPLLRQLILELGQERFGFAVIQTVFEDFDINTFDKLVRNQSDYGLAIPFGHDVASGEDALPATIEDYHTNGTPWFVVINPEGFIIHSHFRVSLESLLEIPG